MLNAPSLKEIEQSISHSLVSTIKVPKGGNEMRMLVPGLDMKNIEFEYSGPKMVGIIFCSPDSELGKQLLSYLQRYHVESGNHCDIYFAGYGMYWPSDKYPDIITVGGTENKEWQFSYTASKNFRNELKSKITSWTYSGETELMLLTARASKEGSAYLDFSCTLAFSLEAILRNRKDETLEIYLQRLFDFTENYNGDNPVFDYSDKEGLYLISENLRDAVFSFIPQKLRELYKQARPFAVKNTKKV